MGSDQATPKWEDGSGNVYADLEIENADKLFAQAQLGYQLWQILQKKNLTRREIADLLGITPKDVSHLLNGRFSRFTKDQVLDFLKRLK